MQAISKEKKGKATAESLIEYFGYSKSLLDPFSIERLKINFSLIRLTAILNIFYTNNPGLSIYFDNCRSTNSDLECFECDSIVEEVEARENDDIASTKDLLEKMIELIIKQYNEIKSLKQN